jgi:hypothetical protein
LLVELRAEPADGTSEAKPVAVPAHRLREREPTHELVQPCGQRLGERPPRDHDPEMAVANLELLGADAMLARESLRRLLAQRFRRAPDPLIRLALRNVLAQEDEPPRRRIDVSTEDGNP